MSKDAEIKKFMAEKINEGVALSEIQKLIDEKFGKKMTFLEVRIMASELENVNWEKEDENAGYEEPEEIDPEEEEEIPEGDGTCVVEISKLVKPGAVAHGSVKFPSGASGDWILDQTGRLGLENSKGKPTPEDLQAFQEELQKAFRS
jgi:hypothetical protein